MSAQRAPDDGLEVHYVGGLEVAQITAPCNGRSPHVTAALAAADSSPSPMSPPSGQYQGASPPPAYNVPTWPAAAGWGQRQQQNYDQHAPIPVFTPADTLHHKDIWGSETAAASTPMMYRAEDNNREQGTVAQAPSKPKQRVFGMRRNLFFTILGAVIMLCIVVIAIAVVMGIKKSKAKHND